MIRYEDHMIGDYVSVNGKIRRIEAITKKKIGFHIHEDKKRLYYARLCEASPINVAYIEMSDGCFIVNGCMEIPFDKLALNLSCVPICDTCSEKRAKWGDYIYEVEHREAGREWHFSNQFGEILRGYDLYVHKLQHIIKMIAPRQKCKK